MTAKDEYPNSAASIKSSTESTIDDASSAALRAREPKGITARKAVEKFIPYLFVLKEKGCSWEQITNLLNSGLGSNLKPSTVRSYFCKMAPKQIDLCRSELTTSLCKISKMNRDQQKFMAAQELFRIAIASRDRSQQIFAMQRISNMLELDE